MSLESILKHILDEAKAQKENILQKAQQERISLIENSEEQAERLYQESIRRENALLEKQKRQALVHARLESKKYLLQTKQELIDAVYIKLKSALKKDKFKKEQIFQDKTREVAQDIDFYLNQVRPDYESEVAKILFL